MILGEIFFKKSEMYLLIEEYEALTCKDVMLNKIAVFLFNYLNV